MKTNVTRLVDVSILAKRPITGGLYKKVFLPFVNGVITVRNLSNIDIAYEGENYTIRVDKTLSKAMALCWDRPQLEDEQALLERYQQQLRLLSAQWTEHGIRLLKEVKDVNSTTQALSNTTPASRWGITIVTDKRINQNSDDPENGEIYLYDVTLPFERTEIVRKGLDVDEMLILLGSYKTAQWKQTEKFFNELKDQVVPNFL